MPSKDENFLFDLMYIWLSIGLRLMKDIKLESIPLVI